MTLLVRPAMISLVITRKNEGKTQEMIFFLGIKNMLFRKNDLDLIHMRMLIPASDEIKKARTQKKKKT